jgi:hypothetical protein
VLLSGRLQVDALAPVGDAGTFQPSVRLQRIPLGEWNATAKALQRRRAHCSALRVRALEHLENSIASASIYKSSYEGLTVDA